MRTGHAAALSVVAVLTAGVAAAIVNTQALAGHGAHTDNALSSMPTLDNTTSSGSVTTVTSAGTRQVFTIGDAGRLTLDRVNGVLVVVSVEPGNGWQVAGVTQVSDTEIAVELTSPTDHVTASAVRGADGIIVVKVTAITSTSGAAPPPPSSSSTNAAPSTATSADPGRPPTATATTTAARPTPTTRPTSPTPTTHRTTTDDDAPSAPASAPGGGGREPDD